MVSATPMWSIIFLFSVISRLILDWMFLVSPVGNMELFWKLYDIIFWSTQMALIMIKLLVNESNANRTIKLCQEPYCTTQHWSIRMLALWIEHHASTALCFEKSTHYLVYCTHLNTCEILTIVMKCIILQYISVDSCTHVTLFYCGLGFVTFWHAMDGLQLMLRLQRNGIFWIRL